MMQTALIPPAKYKLIGHRGVSSLAPENTYCSFKKASELGLNWVEFDIQLTKCKQWIILHDDTLNRTTNGKGPVSQYTWEELKTLEAGLWFHPPMKQERIPRLEPLLSELYQLNLRANIEVKHVPKDCEEYVYFLKKTLEHSQPDWFPKPLISSFDLDFIIALRKSIPTLPISMLIEEYHPRVIHLIQQHQFSALHCDHKNITPKAISDLRKANIPVLCYTVNKPETAKELFQLGVEAIFTDYPQLMIPQMSLDRAQT